MAVYIKIKKIKENDFSVIYEFDSGIKDCVDKGAIEINKISGDCIDITPMPGDTNNTLAKYAYRAILRHWKKGEFPEETCWAS